MIKKTLRAFKGIREPVSDVEWMRWADGGYADAE
jgi:hypothetical protein